LTEMKTFLEYLYKQIARCGRDRMGVGFITTYASRA